MSEDKVVPPGIDISDAINVRHEQLTIAEPKYPILSIDELPLGRDEPDKRNSLPTSVTEYMGPELKVVFIHEHEVEWPNRSVSALEVCMRAARASRPEDIGYRGPTMASISFGEGDNNSRYPDPHGRDDIQAAADLFEQFPRLPKTTAITLAESQGTENETYTPGQPFGQERVGSTVLVDRNSRSAIAQKFERRLHWKPRYYGSVDATPSFINLLARLHKYEPGFLLKNSYKSAEPGAPFHLMSVAFDRALYWLEQNADEHHGLISYSNPVKNGGIRNQGWRDSDAAMVHKDGTWASDGLGIAPIEVAGISFDAWRNSANILRDVHKDGKKASEIEERAWDLQKKVITNGFVHTDEGGYFASGFDWDQHGRLQPIETATSAMGRLLKSQILVSDNPEVQEMAGHTITKLFSPEMITRWGIRTMASDERSYVPFLYHNGPVWPHDTNEIAAGLSNHEYFGLDRIVGALTTNLHEHTGVFLEHAPGNDPAEIRIPPRDTYVYNKDHDVMYLFEQVPPPGQTWAASTEVNKQNRYKKYKKQRVLHAVKPKKLRFEKQIWRQLPDHIKQVVALYEPELALALSK
jgi:hypothetical protein